MMSILNINVKSIHLRLQTHLRGASELTSAMQSEISPVCQMVLIHNCLFPTYHKNTSFACGELTWLNLPPILNTVGYDAITNDHSVTVIDVFHHGGLRLIRLTIRYALLTICEGNRPLAGGFPSKRKIMLKEFPWHDVIMEHCSNGQYKVHQIGESNHLIPGFYFTKLYMTDTVSL